MASIDTAGIHEDDPTVTRDVSANIFYFLDDQDHYVHDSEGRTLMTGLTRSVTFSVDLDTQRTTATVDQDFTWSAEDGTFKVVPYAEPERDDNGREIHRATDGGRILNCNGPVFAHPCVIDGVEHEIEDSSVPSYVAKVQAVHNGLHVYEVQNSQLASRSPSPPPMTTWWKPTSGSASEFALPISAVPIGVPSTRTASHCRMPYPIPHR